jgi:hypothetical protein
MSSEPSVALSVCRQQVGVALDARNHLLVRRLRGDRCSEFGKWQAIPGPALEDISDLRPPVGEVDPDVDDVQVELALQHAFTFPAIEKFEEPPAVVTDIVGERRQEILVVLVRHDPSVPHDAPLEALQALDPPSVDGAG